MFDDNTLCPVCCRPMLFVEDNEDMGWVCEECQVVVETTHDEGVLCVG